MRFAKWTSLMLFAIGRHQPASAYYFARLAGREALAVLR